MSKTKHPIPEGWKEVKVNELAKICTGDKDTQNKIDDGQYPFFVRSQNIERINSFSFDGEAVLTSGDGVGVGKIYHYIKGKFDYHQRVYNIHSFNHDVCGKWFFFVFKSRFPKRVFSMSAKGSVDSVRMEMISDMKIKIPELPEQKAIAQVLTNFDEGIDLISCKIDLLKKRKKGLMKQLLTGKKRLPGFSGEWIDVRLGDVFSFIGGYAFKSSDAIEKGARWLKIANVGIHSIVWNDCSFLPENFIELYPNYVLKKDDIVVALTRPILSDMLKIARIKIIDSGALLNQRVGKIHCNKKIDKLYLYYVLKLVRIVFNINRMLTGTDPPNLSNKDLHFVKTSIPTDTDEQKAIAQVLTDADEQIELYEQKLKKVQKQKKYLLNKLVTGEIRLPEFAPSVSYSLDSSLNEGALGKAPLNEGGCLGETGGSYEA